MEAVRIKGLLPRSESGFETLQGLHEGLPDNAKVGGFRVWEFRRIMGLYRALCLLAQREGSKI